MADKTSDSPAKNDNKNDQSQPQIAENPPLKYPKYSFFHKVKPEYWLSVIAVLAVGIGAIAGNYLSPSDRQPQVNSRASNLPSGDQTEDCRKNGCEQGKACVCSDAVFDWENGICNENYYCEIKPDNQEYCVHTICPVDYHCVNDADPTYCDPND